MAFQVGGSQGGLGGCEGRGGEGWPLTGPRTLFPRQNLQCLPLQVEDEHIPASQTRKQRAEAFSHENRVHSAARAGARPSQTAEKSIFQAIGEAATYPRPVEQRRREERRSETRKASSRAVRATTVWLSLIWLSQAGRHA